MVSAGGRAVSLLSNAPLVHQVIDALEQYDESNQGHIDTAEAVKRLVLRRPLLALRAGLHLAGCALRLGGGLLSGRARRQAVFIHNFMAADALEEDRCASCVFMVATANGPMSMCAHNAQRDAQLAEADQVDSEMGSFWWNPTRRGLSSRPDLPQLDDPSLAPLKRLKGQMRAMRERQRDAS